MNDFRLAFRALRTTPIVSAVAILSLALGIGATTAIFSLINSLLLRPLPVPEPDRLAIVGTGGQSRGWGYAVWEQIRNRPELFDGAFAWTHARFNLAQGGEARLIDGIWASGDFFRVLQIPAVLGRTFTVDDDGRGGGPDGPVAVISQAFWRAHFGGTADVIGKQLRLGGVPFTVIGVTPHGLLGPDVGQRFDVVVPLGTEPLIEGVDSGLDSLGRAWLSIMVRRRAGQTPEAATAGFRNVQQNIRDALPGHRRFGPDLEEPFSLTPAATGQSPLRDRYQRPLVMLLIVAAGVLLIACVNIANLMMARTLTRRHEMSLRVALGASRSRLARLLLAEATLLAGIGAALGLALAQWMTRLLVQQISTSNNVVFFDLSPDWRIWMFAAAATMGTAAVFGAGPAWHSTRADPIDTLKEQGRGSIGGARALFSTTLVSVQIAVSLVLVVAAGLFGRTAAELAQQHVGATKDRLLLVNITPPMTRYTLERLVGTYDRVLEAIRAVPGVERAAISDITPPGGGSRTNFVEVEGGVPLGQRDRLIYVNVISPGWLETYGIRLLAGRDLTHTDAQNTPRVALVNQSFADRFLNGANPVGRYVGVGFPGTMTRHEIVGVVENAVYRSLRESAAPTIYTSTTQRAAARPYVNVSVLASQGSPMLLSRSIASAVRELDPALVLQFRPLAEQFKSAMTQERLVALLSAFFGGLALLLAALGLYGVTANNVSRRRAEIAMRMALGADSRGVVKLVMARMTIVVAAGILCGAMLSVWATQFVGTLVWGLEPRDPMTFITAAMILATVATAAGALPAWRASRIDPAQVLKET